MKQRIENRYKVRLAIAQEQLQKALQRKLAFHDKAQMAKVVIETADPKLWHLNGNPVFDLSHVRYTYDNKQLVRYRFYGCITNFGFQLVEGEEPDGPPKDEGDSGIIIVS